MAKSKSFIRISDCAWHLIKFNKQKKRLWWSFCWFIVLFHANIYYSAHFQLLLSFWHYKIYFCFKNCAKTLTLYLLGRCAYVPSLPIAMFISLELYLLWAVDATFINSYNGDMVSKIRICYRTMRSPWACDNDVNCLPACRVTLNSVECCITTDGEWHFCILC